MLLTVFMNDSIKLGKASPLGHFLGCQHDKLEMTFDEPEQEPAPQRQEEPKEQTKSKKKGRKAAKPSAPVVPEREKAVKNGKRTVKGIKYNMCVMCLAYINIYFL